MADSCQYHHWIGPSGLIFGIALRFMVGEGAGCRVDMDIFAAMAIIRGVLVCVSLGLV
jgi:hypothetical protein